MTIESEYIVETLYFTCKIKVDDASSKIVETEAALQKFKGVQLSILRDWLYKNFKNHYKIRLQERLGL